MKPAQTLEHIPPRTLELPFYDLCTQVRHYLRITREGQESFASAFQREIQGKYRFFLTLPQDKLQAFRNLYRNESGHLIAFPHLAGNELDQAWQHLYRIDFL